MNLKHLLRKEGSGYAPALSRITFPILLACGMFAQQTEAQQRMEAERNNFTSFHPVEKNITKALLENTPEEFQKHPEFGVLPYRAGCGDCVELLQKRSAHSRYFIEPTNPGHFYVQQSYSALHFRNSAGYLQTIDPRLKPVAGRQNVFAAMSQPTPVTYDKNNFATSITAGNLTYKFNQHVGMYYVNTAGEKGIPVPVNHTASTAGENGIYTKNGWDNISVMQEVEVGSVKTTYIIHEPLAIPQNSKYLIFEDAVSLPEGFEMKKGKRGMAYEGYWVGGMQVTNQRGIAHIQYKKPTYYDSYGTRISGYYGLEKEGNQYRISTVVPVEWLQNPATKYPVYIDPLVLSGRDSLGAFLDYTLPDTVFAGANMAFSRSPQWCPYQLTVVVPGKTTLMDALVDVEYKYIDEPNCAIVTPSHPSFFCYFTDISMEVQGPCGTTGQLGCDTTNNPIYIGTCTTDPEKVPGAGALPFPGLVTCLPPQCDDYVLGFEVRNRTFQCQETCDYNCAMGSFFAVTVEGWTIDLEVEASPLVVCAEQEVQLTSKLIYGVPDYRHWWTPTGLGDTAITSADSRDTATAPVVLVYPTQTTTYIDTAYDICNTYFDVDSITIVVTPTPEADAGDTIRLCDGDPPVQIGGNPTGPSGSSATWTAEPPSASAFISGATSLNPLIGIPAGTTGEFQFIVRVEDALCFQFDTMVLNVSAYPIPEIEVDTVLVCEGDTITLSLTEPFAHYHWSTDDTTNAISVTQSGTYSVIVTNANGCTGTATSPLVTVAVPLAVTVFPNDTSIELGGSVTLRTDLNLSGSNVGSYIWSPSQFISCTDCPNPVVTPPATDWYTLEVTSSENCLSEDSVQIRVILPDAYAIPTAFSPNGDSRNDGFYILKASGVTVKEFKVFNRWGQMVHDSAQEPWDGTFKGEPQDIGVYSFVFVLQLFEGGDKIESGDVTLVR